MSTDDDSNTGLVLALVGAGATLAWWLWRGRGSRKPGSGTGGSRKAENPRDPQTDAHRTVSVWIGSGDRVRVDGASMDLATALDRVRSAGSADAVATGDAREGWVRDVREALLATGASIRWRR